MHPWEEKRGAIHFSLMSNGLSGPKWIKHLQAKNIIISENAHEILYSPYFESTHNIPTDIIVLTGSQICGEKYLSTENIFTAASNRGLKKPKLESACLIREAFTNNEIRNMGFSSIVVMHEPIEDEEEDPMFLLLRCERNNAYLNACCNSNWKILGNRTGFAFQIFE